MKHEGFNVMHKGTVANLVTSSDIAVQHLLTERLAALLPGSGFLCEEEDVEGRHAASVGQLSEEILFYLKTRGIDEETARRLMIAGKINTASACIPSESVKAAITQAVDALA